MKFYKKSLFIIILLTVFFIGISISTAADNENNTKTSIKDMKENQEQTQINKVQNNNKTITKEAASKPKVTITSNASSYKGGDYLRVKLKVDDSSSKKYNGYAILKINGKTLTDSKNNAIKVKLSDNKATFKFQMPRLLISSKSTITGIVTLDNVGRLEASQSIKHDKLRTKITINSVRVVNTDVLRIKAALTDEKGTAYMGTNKMTFKVDGKTIVNSNGKRLYFTISGSKIDLDVPISIYKKGNHNLQVVIGSTAEYTETRSATVSFQAKQKSNTKIYIDVPNKANTASKLSIRVYVSYANGNIHKNVVDGKVKISINKQTIKTVDVKYGKAIIAYTTPKTGGTYTLKATYTGGSQVYDKGITRNIVITTGKIGTADSAIEGNRNPLKTSVKTNGKNPNLVYMTNYIWADEDGTYTLTKPQYMEVINRDSYTLYLNNKLSNYVSFQTNTVPGMYLVLSREKWNVFERYLNTLLVKSNGGSYPDSITVNLKGKSYTYSEVRDVQNTGYTCGPTSLSACTQVLRNYNSESKLSRQAGTTSASGSSTSGLKRAAESNNMYAQFYYKSNFDYALNELSKGGCALVFHTWGHYVAILDISKDKKQVLVSNPSGSYNYGSHGIPTKWVSVSYMKKCFNNYDTSGLIVRLNYKLSTYTKNQVNLYYNNFIGGWMRSNTKERIINP